MACFTPELYVYQNIPRAQRSALAKVRCGTAPINITLGKNNKYLTYVRTCFNCVYVIEGECHVLLDWTVYSVEQNNLNDKCYRIVRIVRV